MQYYGYKIEPCIDTIEKAPQEIIYIHCVVALRAVEHFNILFRYPKL